jgi:uncharacterized protein YgiM (DUF1202 family)
MQTKMTKKIGGGAAAAAIVGMLAMAGVAAPASAQGISGVTSCGAPGGKQEAGALIGALVGGVVGNKVGGSSPGMETVVGAGVGAAAGSAIGCKLQHNRANQQYGSTYSRNGYRLSSAISPASYNKINDTFVAESSVNLRSSPSTRSGRVGSLQRGERFQALAEVRGTDWILVGQNGVGVGYVHGDYVRPADSRYASYR